MDALRRNFAELQNTTPQQRRALIAAALGWMLDAFDVMLYALVVSRIMVDLHMGKPVAGNGAPVSR